MPHSGTVKHAETCPATPPPQQQITLARQPDREQNTAARLTTQIERAGLLSRAGDADFSRRCVDGGANRDKTERRVMPHHDDHATAECC